MALACVLNQSWNVFAVVGPANGENFRACPAALEVRLAPEEIAWLELKRDSC